MTLNLTSERGVEDHIKQLVRDQANQLRRMADDIEREANGTRPVHRIVSTTLHTLAWGNANLHTDNLVAWLENLADIKKETAA